MKCIEHREKADEECVACTNAENAKLRAEVDYQFSKRQELILQIEELQNAQVIHAKVYLDQAAVWKRDLDEKDKLIEKLNAEGERVDGDRDRLNRLNGEYKAALLDASRLLTLFALNDLTMEDVRAFLPIAEALCVDKPVGETFPLCECGHNHRTEPGHYTTMNCNLKGCACTYYTEKRKDESRHCVKCGARVEKGDAAHPYTCVGKGDAANPAPFHDCVGVRFCAVCNVRL